MGYAKFIAAFCLTGGALPQSTLAAPPPCLARCEAQRKQVLAQLKECLDEVDPLPKDRAAKMRLLCRKNYQAPWCEGLKPCEGKTTADPVKPRVGLGPLLFSHIRRGPAVKKPSYVPGKELFISLQVEVLTKPSAKRVWLQMDLRVLTQNKQGKEQELIRWEKYFNERKFIDPAERGLTKQYTIHGGAQLPTDLNEGIYVLEAQILEKESGIKEVARASFQVTRTHQGKVR